MGPAKPLEPLRVAAADAQALLRAFADAQAAGLLGKAPLAHHLANGEDFAAALVSVGARRIVDLGSGGGVPALVVAVAMPGADVVMVERGAKRAGFLRDAVGALEPTLAPGRVRVVEGPAEEVARSSAWQGWADAVTARSFGPPSVVAECATRLLQPRGAVVVSEPPADGGATADRWPAEPLRQLGLAPLARLRGVHTTFQVLTRVGEADPRYPRRDAVTRKRLLF